MKLWICIGWRDEYSWEDEWGKHGKKIPTPVTIQAEAHDELSHAQILSEFRRNRPDLRNHTVTPHDLPLATKHLGPGRYPIAVPSSYKLKDPAA